MYPRLLSISALAFVVAAPVVAGFRTNSGAGALAEVFSTPQPYATPLRLERTPRMDGVYRPEEWDMLWGDGMPTVAPGTRSAVGSGAIGVATTAAPQTAASTTAAQTGSTSAASTQKPGSTAPGVTLLTPGNTAPAAKAQSTTPAGNVPLAPTNIEPIRQDTVAVPVSQAAFMSWEPGKLYFGAILAPGHDMLISLDAGNNGFLVGSDNVEFRVVPGTAGSPATVKARIMDATASTGPAWVDAPGYAMAGTVVSAPRPDGSTFVEFAVVDPGYNVLNPELKKEFGLRVDSIPSASPQAEAFLPRLMSKVKLTDQRVTNLPAGIDASVGPKGRSALPGDGTTVRWQFNGSDAVPIKSLEIGGEGALGDRVNFLRVPSPAFDPKGQAIVDFPTRIVQKTPVGYGVLRGDLTGTNWSGAYIESSFRIASTIDINAPAKKVISTGKALSITCKADIISNTEEKVDGNFQVLPPEGWRVIDGTNKSFFVPAKGATAKRQFVLGAPVGVHGTFKATLRVVVLGEVFDQPYWITIV